MRTRKQTMTALALAAVLAIPGVAAASRYDGARRQAPRAGLISLQDAADAAEKAFGGRAVEAELEREDGRRVYEVKLVRDGERMEIYVDARTGEVTGPERARQGRLRPGEDD